MKYIFTIAFALFIAVLINSCSKDDNPPFVQSPKLDTSTTLITDAELVGKWNIVSDSVSLQGNSVNYKGGPSDHYTFTKYGNLYINEGFGGSFIDTAVYGITSGHILNWLNIYINVNGSSTTVPSNSPPFTIRMNEDSLELTSNALTNAGQRYERIRFIKQ